MPYTINTAGSSLPNSKEITPQAMANGSEDVYVGDCWLDQLILTPDATASNVTVTVQDKQGTPIPVVSATLSAGELVQLRDLEAKMIGGITVTASAANKIYIRMRFRH